MDKQILNFYCNTHAAYLHANGKASTDLAIYKLNCKTSDTVLEIGFGTGATLALLASNFKKSKFIGVELSHKMKKKAQQRLNFSGIKNNISLNVLKDNLTIPLASESVDKLIIQSVLAILNKEDLNKMLTEISRVLKPKASLVINETIWLDSSPLHEILNINNACIDAFGIIQSSSDYPYEKNWKSLFKSYAIDINESIDLTSIKPSRSYNNIRSSIFDKIGNIKKLIIPKLRLEQKNYDYNMSAILENYPPLMKGVLFIGEKASY